jgi:hypothetical protein
MRGKKGRQPETARLPPLVEGMAGHQSFGHREQKRSDHLHDLLQGSRRIFHVVEEVYLPNNASSSACLEMPRCSAMSPRMALNVPTRSEA